MQINSPCADALKGSCCSMTTWLTKAELRGALRPALWVLVGVLVGDAYLFGLLQAPLVFVATVPLFLPQAVILSALLLTPPRRWWLPFVVYSVYLLVHALLRGN